MGWNLSWLRRERDTLDSEARGFRIPDGQRVYAIGDVHGRLDLLIGLLGRIRSDNQKREPAETHVVLLGDIIDRGPQSAQLVEFLRSQRGGFAQFHFVLGNHEEAMLASLSPGSLPEDTGWLSYGGYETMISYGAEPSLFNQRGVSLAGAMRQLIPDAHIDFLESFVDQLKIGDYVFVHAGIRPGVPLDRQDARDLRWIRGDFLEDRRDHGVIVVHGHTIATQPEMLENRIGIDTGAYLSGILTAVGLEDADRWLVQERQ